MTLTDKPLPYLPYHVKLNGEHHRIMYYKTEMVEVHKETGLRLPFNVWRDWFTDQEICMGDWIVADLTRNTL